MKLRELVNPHIRDLAPYVPGKPIERSFRASRHLERGEAGVERGADRPRGARSRRSSPRPRT
jgi:hypothetical protein